MNASSAERAAAPGVGAWQKLRFCGRFVHTVGVAGPQLLGQASDLTLERHSAPIRSILNRTGLNASVQQTMAVPSWPT